MDFKSSFPSGLFDNLSPTSRGSTNDGPTCPTSLNSNNSSGSNDPISSLSQLMTADSESLFNQKRISEIISHFQKLLDSIGQNQESQKDKVSTNFYICNPLTVVDTALILDANYYNLQEK